MRRSTRLTWLAMAVVLATACGGASKKSAPPPLTAAQAQSLAAAAVLTGADLPGFAVKKQTRNAQDDADEARFRACLGLGKTAYLARDAGVTFSKGHAQVSSSADVASSAAAVKREVDEMTRPKALACLTTEGRKELAATGLSVRDLALTPFDVGLAGVRTFGYRIDARGTVKGSPFAIIGYQLGAVAADQVEVSLSQVAAAGAPSLSLGQLVQLLSTATQRATAARA